MSVIAVEVEVVCRQLHFRDDHIWYEKTDHLNFISGKNIGNPTSGTAPRKYDAGQDLTSRIVEGV
jgi:hypothetical protein